MSGNTSFFKSEQIDQLAKALSKSQGEFQPIEKNGINSYHKSKFSTLSDIEAGTQKTLAANGLSVTQMPYGGNGKNIELITLLMHTGGQFIGTSFLMEAKEATAQGVAGCITYMRRYAKAGILGVCSEEDDDGHHATFGASQFDNTRPPANDDNKYKGSSPIKVESVSQDPNTYVIPFGKKFKGMRITDVPTNELFNYVEYMKRSTAGKDISPSLQIFFDMAELVLNDNAASFVKKMDNDNSPLFDSGSSFTDNDIPFFREP